MRLKLEYMLNMSINNMTNKIISMALTFSLIAVSHTARSQSLSLSTNLLDWLALGSINFEGGVAVGRHMTLHTGLKVNPWTFKGNDSDKQYQSRQQTYYGGIRLWPWNIYSGWWFGTKAQYQEYNRGGIFSRKTEEGDAYGISLSAGYTLMLHKHLNLDFGVGMWGGMKKYTVYSCPRCGDIQESGKKFFYLPDSMSVAIVYIF